VKLIIKPKGISGLVLILTWRAKDELGNRKLQIVIYRPDISIPPRGMTSTLILNQHPLQFCSASLDSHAATPEPRADQTQM
jgi:hypothetical protein